ncbi:MAG: PLP-dependent aminotransferase family protein [Acholeplasmatales bacterium]|nr:PLP-dependent aminotransferase family protein [Acholeplasmatales bacterium]
MVIVFKNEKPKYLELYDQIVKMIEDGTLKANEHLPSKRNMAINLDISLSTVLNAYNLLIDEGYIYTKEKKGYYVSEMPFCHQNKIKIEKIKQTPINYKYDFTTQSVSNFNSTHFKKILRDLSYSNDYLDKSPLLGRLDLRIAISNHLAENRAIHASADNILIGTGLEMLEKIIKLIDVDNITLENPGYHKLKIIGKNNNYKINYQPLDDEGVIVPNYKTILYTTPFNQFPTGIKMSIKRKKELISNAIKYESYIIEDDFDAEFRINQAPTTSIYSLSNSNTIFFSTFSNTLFPGFRLAYAILPDEILKKYLKTYKNYNNPVSSLTQIILKEFINNGGYASYINKRKKELIIKRNKCIEKLKSIGNIDIKKNYLSLLIDINSNLDELIEKAKLNNIKIQSLKSFDVKENKTNTLIIGYTAIDENKIDDALDELIKIIKGAN